MTVLDSSARLARRNSHLRSLLQESTDLVKLYKALGGAGGRTREIQHRPVVSNRSRHCTPKLTSLDCLMFR